MHPDVRLILLFLLYSYVKSHLDNDSCLPIYKTIPAICNTPHQTRASEFHFSAFVMVITCCGPSCGLWLCVGALNRGAPKIFRKLLRRRNHSSGISRAGPTTTVIFFLFSVHLRALCRVFYGTSLVCLLGPT